MASNVSNKNYVYFVIEKLLDRYNELTKLYLQSLKKHESLSLQYEMKIYLGDAISILDYCAHDIADFYVIKCSHRTAFPIVYLDNDMNVQGFGRKTDNILSGLNSHQTIFAYLESVQPYKEGFEWMADVAKLNNEHKHVRLVPQIQNKIHSILIEGVIGMTGAEDKQPTISLGSGSSIEIPGDKGKKIIYGDQELSPLSQSIKSNRPLDICKTTWVDFRFENSDISARYLIKKIRDNLPDIVENIYKFLS